MHRAAFKTFVYSLVLVLGFSLLASPHTVAQRTAKKEQKERAAKSLDKQMQRLTKALDLSDEQAAEIRLILEEGAKRGAEIRNEFKGDREALQEARQANRQQIDSQIAAVLTEGQAALYTEMKTKKAKKKKRRSANRTYKKSDGENLDSAEEQEENNPK